MLTRNFIDAKSFLLSWLAKNYDGKLEIAAVETLSGIYLLNHTILW